MTVTELKAGMYSWGNIGLYDESGREYSREEIASQEQA